LGDGSCKGLTVPALLTNFLDVIDIPFPVLLSYTSPMMRTLTTINSQNPLRINCIVSLLFFLGDRMFCGSFSWLSALQGGGRVNFWSSIEYLSRGKNAFLSLLYNFEQGRDLDIASANRNDRKPFFRTAVFSLKNLRPIVLSLA